MLIITTGKQVVDIDGIACVYALTNAYNLLGISAWPVIEGGLAPTVTSDIKRRLPRFANRPPDNFRDFQVGLVDVSDPKSLPSFARANRISFLIDHHVGYQEYWEHAIGSRACIEFIGSCASQVWEEIVKLRVHDKLDQLSYELLALGIVSNTLNFKATIANHRDRAAYNDICTYLEKNIRAHDYINRYYNDYQKKVELDIPRAALRDTKSINAVCIAQLEVWQNLNITDEDVAEIFVRMKSEYSEDQLYFINIVLINEGVNRIYANKDVRQELCLMLDGTIVNDHIELSQLTLRKELYKTLLKKNSGLAVQPAKQHSS